MKRTAIIYHKDCPDGAASALVAHQALSRPDITGDTRLEGAEFIPMAYGERPDWARFSGYTVRFLDFSWPRDALLALADVANEIHVIDHHKTAQAALADIPMHAPGRCPIYITFDMTRCGCVLTHRAMLPDIEIDQFFLYIQDRDLWQWKLPHSREFSATVSTYGRTLEGMQAAFKDWRTQTSSEFLRVGGRVLALQKQTAQNLASTASHREFYGFHVPVCNVPQETGLQSEVGEILAEGSLFSVCYGDSSGKRRYSLRSSKKADGTQFDCSNLAKQLKGGGHVGAAGFTVDLAP